MTSPERKSTEEIARKATAWLMNPIDFTAYTGLTPHADAYYARAESMRVTMQKALDVERNEADRLSAEIVILGGQVRKALERFGGHTITCKRKSDRNLLQCTCGYFEALTQIEPKNKSESNDDMPQGKLTRIEDDLPKPGDLTTEPEKK